MIFRKKIFLIITLLICVLYNITFIYPYYNNKSGEIKNADISIACLNLLSSNSEFEKTKNYIQEVDPDVLVLLEFNDKWLENLKPVLTKYAFSELKPRNDNFGIAVLSKNEMKSVVRYFNQFNLPSIVCEMNIDEHRVSLLATHPMPPINSLAFESRNAQLKSIVHKRKSFSENFILIGDFNSSSFSSNFQKWLVNGMKDSRIGFGLQTSWPAGFLPLRTTLDHCLVSENITVVTRTTGIDIGSDHLPIYVELKFKD